MINEKLVQARKKMNMTQEDLAEKTGINRVTLARYERGIFHPNAENLVKLARALKVKTSFFSSVTDDYTDLKIDNTILSSKMKLVLRMTELSKKSVDSLLDVLIKYEQLSGKLRK